MALDVTTALTTVADVAEELGITPTEAQTSYIEKLIASASAAAAKFCNRTFGFEADIVEAPKGFGSVRIRLERAPIYAVSEILIDEDEIESTEWIVESRGKTGLIYLKGRAPITGVTTNGIDPEYRADTEAQDPDQLRVTYSAGWILPGQLDEDGVPEAPLPADAPILPDDIARAVIWAVTAQFRRKGMDRTISSERLMSESTTWADSSTSKRPGIGGWPADATDALRPYRIVSQC